MKNQNPSDQKKSNKISRRKFIATAGKAAVGFTIVPRFVLGGPGYVPPSDKLNIACVGVGGKGTSDIAAVAATENIYALCDVDDTQMAKATPKYASAQIYQDYRKMLEDNHQHIDAVTVSTPDHTHAVIAMAAIKMGKHVFVQKPLTHTVKEARLLAQAAREYKVVTQMGNQGHAGEGARLINEWIWDGAIGPVREVFCWTNRPIWPQGIKAPEEPMEVPETLKWHLWLGPAKFRPYHEAYCPFRWRGWWDFGTGALGDMGAHIIDQPFWALNLGAPSTVEASSTPFTADSYPMASIVRYEFPARGEMPPVKFTWYDGGLMPPRPDELEAGRMMGDSGGGVLFVGDKGKLMCSVYGGNPRLIPETKMREYQRPEKTIPRSPGIHEEWVAACKGQGKTTSNFDYASQLTEMMLLGNIAIRMSDQKTKLQWDTEQMAFSNLPEANQYLEKEYYGGFGL